MDTVENQQVLKIKPHFRTIAGALLMAAGGALFIDQYLKTGWLSLVILPAVGLFLYGWGIRARVEHLLIAGGILTGLGVGWVVAQRNPQAGLTWQAGSLLIFFGLGWLLVTAGTRYFTNRTDWWALIPGCVLGGLGLTLLFSQLRWMDLALSLAIGVAIPLLIWGLAERKVGLIIPGSLLVGIGPGLFHAWGVIPVGNGLVSTGIMLVWFSLGWFLILVFTRMVKQRVAWWPLIPGGILGVVGTGLYIGGDPSNALGFIGNTGSIGLMIFGLYLLLMRKGIHH
jgi:hypothetical protein